MGMTNGIDRGETLVRAWALDQKRRGVLPSSTRQMCDQVRRLDRWLGDRDLLDASAEDIETMLDARAISPRTRYGYLSALAGFYGWAVRAGHATTNPTADIIRPKMRRSLPRPIGEEDLQRAILSAGQPMRAWLVLASYGGLRCAEIAGLKREDVLDSWNPAMLRVLGKGQKERLVPAHPLILEEVRRLGRPSGPLFVERNRLVKPGDVSRRVAAYLREMGIEATCHQLRHRFGTEAYRACRDLRAVQELLGHSSPVTAAGYAAAAPDVGLAAVLALPGALPQRDPRDAA